MNARVFFQGNSRIRYFFVYPFMGTEIEVSEEDFFALVGYDRDRIPSRYAHGNVNRKDFYKNGVLIAYLIREKN